MWKSTEIKELDQYTLADLKEGSLPAVRLKQFASKTEITLLASSLLEQACRTNSIDQVTRLGISQYEQGLNCSKSEYFALAKQLSTEFELIYDGSFSPIKRLIERLRGLDFDIDLMFEPGHGAYFAGSGKLRNGYSPIHVDYAPQDSAGWAVAEATAQLAWNLYLQVPETGGDLLLWDKQWQPEDDRYQVSDSYYYDDDVVSGAPMMRVTVESGDVLIINSRNFHAVSEVADRLAIGSFVSCFADGSLRLWS